MIPEQHIRSAISAFGDKAGMFIELTTKDVERYLTELNTALENQNAEGVGLAAHALKSIFNQINASQIADLAAQIEAYGKSQTLEHCEMCIELMTNGWKHIKSFLENYS